MKPFLKKHYYILAGTAIVCVLGCVGFFALLHSMKEKEARVHEVKQTLATYEQNKKVFAEENEKVQSLNARIVAMETLRITDATVPTLLSSFEAMGEARGVVVTITSVQTPDIDGEKRLFVDFSATGGFQELNSLIEAMLTQKYQTQFATLSLFQDGSSAGWQMLGSLEIISF